MQSRDQVGYLIPLAGHTTQNMAKFRIGNWINKSEQRAKAYDSIFILFIREKSKEPN